MLTPSTRHVPWQLDHVPSASFLWRKKIEELSHSFNKGLLSSTCEDDSSESSDDDDLDTEQHLPNPTTKTTNDYTSQAWETTITNVTNAYHPVKQPTNANRVQTLLQPSQTS